MYSNTYWGIKYLSVSRLLSKYFKIRIVFEEIFQKYISIACLVCCLWTLHISAFSAGLSKQDRPLAFIKANTEKMSSFLWTACHKLFLKNYQISSLISLWPVLIFNCQCLLVPLLLNWTRSSFLGIVVLFDLPPPPQLSNSFPATKSP